MLQNKKGHIELKILIGIILLLLILIVIGAITRYTFINSKLNQIK